VPFPSKSPVQARGWLALGAAATVLMSCSGGGGVHTEGSGTEPRPSLNFVAGQFVNREGNFLALLLLESGATVMVDLTRTAVFDCRSDCLEDVRARVGKLDGASNICVYGTSDRNGVRVQKLWVERTTPPCP